MSISTEMAVWLVDFVHRPPPISSRVLRADCATQCRMRAFGINCSTIGFFASFCYDGIETGREVSAFSSVLVTPQPVMFVLDRGKGTAAVTRM